MSSPRSMWSGTLRLGLLTVPITLAKATSEQREKALVTVCEHGVPINRSERCGAGEETCTLSKSKAVQVGEDEYRTLEPNEYLAIEDSTKSDTLDVLDVQPLRELPLIFGMGTYYCLGAALARMETDECLRILLERCPGLRPAYQTPDRQRSGPIGHRLGSLPVAF